MGPYFKKHAPNVRALRFPGDAGLPLSVAGTVVNVRGNSVPSATIDIWQADHAGHYDIDGQRYRTKLLLGSFSNYAVETIMPGRYSDRPVQHIHFLIAAPGYRPLATQLYFATDPFFEGDPDKNYNKNGLVEHRELVRPVTLHADAEGTCASVVFDICLESA